MEKERNNFLRRSEMLKPKRKKSFGAVVIAGIIGLAVVAIPVVVAFTALPKSESIFPVAAAAYVEMPEPQQTVAPTEEPLPTATQSPKPSAEPTITPKPTQTPPPLSIDLGYEGQEVPVVQERLMALYYMDHDEPTSFYGQQTKLSVSLFQRKNDLPIDGILTQTTLDALMSENAQPYTLSLGTNGMDVREIQLRLKELGYLKGSTTGYFNDETESAVIDFQKVNKLDADGNVGHVTREKLYSEDVLPAPTPTPKPVKTPSPSKTQAPAGTISPGTANTPSASVNPSATPTLSADKTKTPESATNAPDGAMVSALVEFTRSQLGKPYVGAAKGPDAFDCSGFVYYCLNSIGKKMGYMTSAGWAKANYPTVYSINDLRAGDIVCFKGHVGIYIGNGQMIDASSTESKVRISSNLGSSSYWRNNFICGKRVL